MAHETLNDQERIIQDPTIVDGKPVVKGTRIPVEVILGNLADNPDLDELFGVYPELELDDVRAVLAYARDRVQTTGGRPPAVQSPQDFYAAFTARADVAELMRRLAK